ncbi:glycine--tRNA ligase subunit beta, partial [Sphingomonas sp.]|uniref:glycine--tRNA ligase subunit beta n=1 Tax=Sphingomonas sp. TaxID=28214 RepID=UPI0025F43ED9
AVSLADKLDSLAGFYAIGEKPTGSKDPFALRRAALGIVALIEKNGLRYSVSEILRVADRPFAESDAGSSASFNQLLDFTIDRLKVQQREAGVRHDLIDSIFALGTEDDLFRLLARVKALQAFITTAEGANLLSGYKRASNILKKETFSTDVTLLSYTPEPAEKALIDALDSAEPLATAAIAREDFEGAMSALASLRGPIDAFFESVTVNDPQLQKRAARLALLARMRDAVHRVADFSKIDG